MNLDELNKKFEDLNNTLKKSNLEDYYLKFLSNAPTTIIPGASFTITDQNGIVISQEKAGDIVIDTAGEIRGLIGHLEEAMTLLKEYKQQAEKLEHTIDGLIKYAENEAAVGQYDNIIGAKVIGHAIETKFLYGYIPQDRFKQFEKRLTNIRHLSLLSKNLPSTNRHVEATVPAPQQITDSNEQDEELDKTTKLERVKKAITQLMTEKFGDTQVNFQKANWYAVFFVFEKKVHPNITPKTFSDLMKTLGLIEKNINDNISHAVTINLPAHLHEWKAHRYGASAADKKQIDVALRFMELLKENKVL